MKTPAVKKLLLFFTTITLLLPSCASRLHTRASTAVSHEATRQTDTDTSTVAYRRHTLLRTTPIPASQARLTLPLDPIRQLPEGAGYTQKAGQATATLRFHHDTLYIYATCDSLQTLLYTYEEEINRLHRTSATRQTVSENKTEQKKTTARLLRPACLLLLLMAAFTLVALAKKRKAPKS